MVVPRTIHPFPRCPRTALDSRLSKLAYSYISPKAENTNNSNTGTPQISPLPPTYNASDFHNASNWPLFLWLYRLAKIHPFRSTFDRKKGQRSGRGTSSFERPTEPGMPTTPATSSACRPWPQTWPRYKHHLHPETRFAFEFNELIQKQENQ